VEADSQATFLAVEEAPAVSDRPSRTVRALFEHELLDVTWSRYEDGEKGPDPHVHHRHVDAFFVVEGELRFRVGPALEALEAPTGTFVLVPPNVTHTFENASGATARWLNFHAPSTGFLAHLRGERQSWDSHDPPADGGRPAADATVSRTRGGHIEVLGEEERLSAIALELEPGFAVGPHRHDERVDSFFVLDGEVEFTLGGEVVRAGPGSWVAAPPGARHGFRSLRHARAVTFSAPDAGFAARMRS
jgi:quercetin dioxygenase-like cupin family protein